MRKSNSLPRRGLLKLALGVPLIPVLVARVGRAADAPLLSPDAPEAKAVKYVEDASKARRAAGPSRAPDNTCATCGLYQGASGAALGPCQLFPGKQVKAAGWCASWAPQI